MKKGKENLNLKAPGAKPAPVTLSKTPLSLVLAPIDNLPLRDPMQEEPLTKLRAMLNDERKRNEEIRSLLETERLQFEEEKDAYAAAVSLLTSERDEAYEAAKLARSEVDRIKSELRDETQARDALLHTAGAHEAQSRHLAQLEQKVAALSAENDELKNAKLQLTAARETLQLQLRTSADSLSKTTQELERLRSQFEASSSRVSDLENANQELREKVECLQVDADIKATEILEARRREVEAREAARGQSDGFRSELDHLIRELSEMQAEAERKEETFARQQERMEELRRELQDTRERAEAAEIQVQELTTELATAARVNACHCKHLADTRSELGRVEAERDALRADLESVRAYADKILKELSGVTADLRAESESVAALRSSSLQLEKSNAALQDENSRLKCRVQYLGDQLQERGGELEPGRKGPLQTKIDELTAQLQVVPALKSETSALRATISELQSEGDRLRQSLREAQEAQSALKKLKEENDTLRTTLAAARTEITSFGSALEATEQELALAYRERLGEVSATHGHALQEAQSELRQVKSELQSELDRLKLQLQDTLQEKATVQRLLQDEEEEWSRARGAYEAQIASLTARCEELAGLLSPETSTAEEDDDPSSPAPLTPGMLALQTQVQVAQAERDRLTAEITALQDRIKRRETQLASDLTQVRGQLDCTLDERDRLSVELQRAQDELSLLTERCGLLEDRITALASASPAAAVPPSTPRTPSSEAAVQTEATSSAQELDDGPVPSTPAPTAQGDRRCPASAPLPQASTPSSTPRPNADEPRTGLPKKTPAWLPRVARLAEQRRQEKAAAAAAQAIASTPTPSLRPAKLQLAASPAPSIAAAPSSPTQPQQLRDLENLIEGMLASTPLPPAPSTPSASGPTPAPVESEESARLKRGLTEAAKYIRFLEAKLLQAHDALSSAQAREETRDKSTSTTFSPVKALSPAKAAQNKEEEEEAVVGQGSPTLENEPSFALAGPSESEAALRIQTHWRAFQARKVLQSLRQERDRRETAARAIQRSWRAASFLREVAATASFLREEAHVRSYAAHVIQAWWRRCLEHRRRERAVRAIQRAWRAAVLRKRISELAQLQRDVTACRFAAATLIQRSWRTRRTLRIVAQLAKRSAAATRIQALYRGHVARGVRLQLEREQARAREERERRERAAVVLQSLWRGHRARALAASLRLQRCQEAAAVTLQSAWRGHRARQLASELRRERQEAAARAILAQKERERRERAAVVLQSLWRGHRARQLASELRRERQEAAARAILAQNERERRESAAVVLQSLWRGHRARALAASLRLQRRQEAAAVTLQCAWRGHRARQLASELRRERQEAAAVTLQSLWRGHRARQLASELRRERQGAAARRIQRAWRAHTLWKGVQAAAASHRRQTAAATHIQRAWRGTLLWRSIQYCAAQQRARHAAARVLQRSWRATVLWNRVQDLAAQHRARMEQEAGFREAAAQAIQRWWRTRIFTLRLQGLAAYGRAEIERRRRQNAAATRIQAAWRGYAVRTVLRHEREVAEVARKLQFRDKLLQSEGPKTAGCGALLSPASQSQSGGATAAAKDDSPTPVRVWAINFFAEGEDGSFYASPDPKAVATVGGAPVEMQENLATGTSTFVVPEATTAAIGQPLLPSSPLPEGKDRSLAQLGAENRARKSADATTDVATSPLAPAANLNASGAAVNFSFAALALPSDREATPEIHVAAKTVGGPVSTFGASLSPLPLQTRPVFTPGPGEIEEEDTVRTGFSTDRHLSVSDSTGPADRKDTASSPSLHLGKTLSGDVSLSEGVRKLLADLAHSPSPTVRQMTPDGDRFTQSCRASVNGEEEDAEGEGEVTWARTGADVALLDESSFHLPLIPEKFSPAPLSAANRTVASYTAAEVEEGAAVQPLLAQLLPSASKRAPPTPTEREVLETLVPPLTETSDPEPLLAPAVRETKKAGAADGLPPRRALGLLPGGRAAASNLPSAARPPVPLTRTVLRASQGKPLPLPGVRAAPLSMMLGPPVPSRTRQAATRKVGPAPLVHPSGALVGSKKGWNPRDGPSPLPLGKRPAAAAAVQDKENRRSSSGAGASSSSSVAPRRLFADLVSRVVTRKQAAAPSDKYAHKIRPLSAPKLPETKDPKLAPPQPSKEPTVRGRKYLDMPHRLAPAGPGVSQERGRTRTRSSSASGRRPSSADLAALEAMLQVIPLRGPAALRASLPAPARRPLGSVTGATWVPAGVATRPPSRPRSLSASGAGGLLFEGAPAPSASLWSKRSAGIALAQAVARASSSSSRPRSRSQNSQPHFHPAPSARPFVPAGARIPARSSSASGALPPGSKSRSSSLGSEPAPIKGYIRRGTSATQQGADRTSRDSFKGAAAAAPAKSSLVRAAALSSRRPSSSGVGLIAPASNRPASFSGVSATVPTTAATRRVTAGPSEPTAVMRKPAPLPTAATAAAGTTRRPQLPVQDAPGWDSSVRPVPLTRKNPLSKPEPPQPPLPSKKRSGSAVEVGRAVSASGSSLTSLVDPKANLKVPRASLRQASATAAAASVVPAAKKPSTANNESRGPPVRPSELGPLKALREQSSLFSSEEDVPSPGELDRAGVILPLVGGGSGGSSDSNSKDASPEPPLRKESAASMASPLTLLKTPADRPQRSNLFSGLKNLLLRSRTPSKEAALGATAGAGEREAPAPGAPFVPGNMDDEQGWDATTNQNPLFCSDDIVWNENEAGAMLDLGVLAESPEVTGLPARRGAFNLAGASTGSLVNVANSAGVNPFRQLPTTATSIGGHVAGSMAPAGRQAAAAAPTTTQAAQPSAAAALSRRSMQRKVGSDEDLGGFLEEEGASVPIVRDLVGGSCDPVTPSLVGARPSHTIDPSQLAQAAGARPSTASTAGTVNLAAAGTVPSVATPRLVSPASTPLLAAALLKDSQTAAREDNARQRQLLDATLLSPLGLTPTLPSAFARECPDTAGGGAAPLTPGLNTTSKIPSPPKEGTGQGGRRGGDAEAGLPATRIPGPPEGERLPWNLFERRLNAHALQSPGPGAATPTPAAHLRASLAGEGSDRDTSLLAMVLESPPVNQKNNPALATPSILHDVSNILERSRVSRGQKKPQVPAAVAESEQQLRNNSSKPFATSRVRIAPGWIAKK